MNSAISITARTSHILRAALRASCYLLIKGKHLPVPRFCRRNLLSTSSNLLCLLRLGSLTCTPPRRPVPRLEGQVRTYPRCSFHINACPLLLNSSSIWKGTSQSISYVQNSSADKLLNYLYYEIIPLKHRLADHLCEACAETSKHFLHVATFLHGDDTQVILLIHPHKECFVVIVPENHLKKKKKKRGCD